MDLNTIVYYKESIEEAGKTAQNNMIVINPGVSDYNKCK